MAISSAASIAEHSVISGGKSVDEASESPHADNSKTEVHEVVRMRDLDEAALRKHSLWQIYLRWDVEELFMVTTLSRPWTTSISAVVICIGYGAVTFINDYLGKNWAGTVYAVGCVLLLFLAVVNAIAVHVLLKEGAPHRQRVRGVIINQVITNAVFFIASMSSYTAYPLRQECYERESAKNSPDAYYSCVRAIEEYTILIQLIPLLFMEFLHFVYPLLTVLFVAVTLFATRPLAPNDTDVDLASKVVLRFAITLLVMFGVVFNHLIARRRFEARAAVVRNTHIWSERKQQVDASLRLLMPEAVIEKLGEGEMAFVSCPAVTVVATQICDFASLSSSCLPAVVVRTIDRLFGEFDQVVSTRFSLFKIRTVGDLYLCSTSLEPKSADAPWDVDLGVVDPNTPVVQALKMAAFQLRIGRRLAALERCLSALCLRAGVHTSACVGFLAVSHTITYEVAGPAMDGAIAIAAAAPRDTVLVSGPTLALAEGFASTAGPDVVLPSTQEKVGTFIIQGQPRRSRVDGSAYSPISERSMRHSVVASPSFPSMLPAAKKQRRLFERLLAVEGSESGGVGIGGEIAERQNFYASLRENRSRSAHGDSALDTEAGGGGAPSGFLPYDTKPILLTFRGEELECRYSDHASRSGTRVNHRFHWPLLIGFNGLILFIAAFSGTINLDGGLTLLTNIILGCIWMPLQSRFGPRIPPVVEILCVCFVYGLLFEATVLFPHSIFHRSAWLQFIICVHALHVSSRCRWWVASLVVIGVTLTSILSDYYRVAALLLSTLVTSPLFGLYCVYAAYQLERVRRKHFLTRYFAETAQQEAKNEMVMQRKVLERIVPPTVVEIVMKKNDGDRDAIIETLGEVCVCMLRFDGFQRKLADTDSASTLVHYAEQLMFKVESFFAKSKVGSKVISRIYNIGDLMLLGGPVLEQKAPSLPQKSTTAFGQEQRPKGEGNAAIIKSEELVLRAAMCLVEFCTNAKQFPSCSILLDSGAAFAAVLGTHRPTFTLLGPATRNVEALMDAAPPGVRAATTRFCELVDLASAFLPTDSGMRRSESVHGHEVPFPVQRKPDGLKNGNAYFQLETQRWAVKGCGSVRLRMLVPAAGPVPLGKEM